YRPSPVALRLPAPTNDAERALQLTTTGYTPGQTLLNALLEAELILFAQPQGTGLFLLEHESGRRQLQVFTSDNYLPPNWSTWQRMTGRQLAGHNLTGVDLQINPTSPVKARIPGEDLVKAAGANPPKTPAPIPPASDAATKQTPV
ncbi:SseB family protein, partial [Klebsiella pneumoniae]|nr:SseB family protein [Klebsiella pneumoniae]